METKGKDFKGHLIEVIRKSEDMAKETIEISIEQDLFEIKEYKFNEGLYKKLLSELIAKTVAGYNNTHNYYKASNEQFAFLNSEVREAGTKKLDNNDRLDFIAMVLQSYLDWEPEDMEGKEVKLDALGQMKNLESIVYETRTLELKKKAYLMMLGNLTKEQTEPHPDEKKLWFQTGLLFATGQMDKFYNSSRTGIRDSYTAPKIAKELGKPEIQKYILATMKNYDTNNRNGDKNIFNSRNKMQRIISYCEASGLEVVADFKERIPSE